MICQMTDLFATVVHKQRVLMPCCHDDVMVASSGVGLLILELAKIGYLLPLEKTMLVRVGAII